MNIFAYHIPASLVYTLSSIFSVLAICSASFRLLAKRKASSLSTELIIRTKSWWYIAIGLSAVVCAPPLVGTILVAYVSFVALREVFSIVGFRKSDRGAFFVAYLAIPVQYFLAYQQWDAAFSYFIPFIMSVLIGFLLVIAGDTKNIGRSMAMIPAALLLTVFFISHIVRLFHIEVQGFHIGSGGLIIFLIALTSFNDVFQFCWGKLLGKRKILPSVSPNKTWEGFIGGVLSTSVLGYVLHFLTPLSAWEALITGFCLGIGGFIGDTLISAIKRDLGLKDTDDLIPGHGGALDRLDSLFVTAPAFYYLLHFFI